MIDPVTRHRTRPIAVAVAEARNHWKMLRRRGDHPRRIAQARRRIATLVNELQILRHPAQPSVTSHSQEKRS
jgi:hypothetical protein